MNLKELVKSFIKSPVGTWKLGINRLGNQKECYVCKRTFRKFTRFRGGYDQLPLWHKKLNVVGSDLDHFRCMYCGAHDRERHLFMFFDHLDLWSRMKQSKIIHFGPEKNLSKSIEQAQPEKYIKADLYPADASIQKIDVTQIPFQDDAFDMIICNHVLEHVPDYRKAISEIMRVLKKGGIAILQTPYSKLLQSNFEDEGINTEELRTIFYGQEDHVRYFSERQFFQSLTDAGFKLYIIKHGELSNKDLSAHFGVNPIEDLVQVIKL